MIALYISIFFEWRMALAAIIAVIHDILVTVGIYSLTGLEVTPDTVVAFLTILGYSLYDTIVVFDRVRDNTRHLSFRDRVTYSDVVDLSMNQTLARSINTSLVAVMPILAVLILGAEILGATTLQYFGLALLVGLTTGAYSSIFIASPLVAMMKEREPRYRQIAERIALRGTERVHLTPAMVAAGFGGESLSAAAGRRTRAAEGAANTSPDREDVSTRTPTRPSSRRPNSPSRPRSNRGRPKGGRR
jgi:preprotein translocase subunit SecF